MFGILRFFLAILVLIGHLPITNNFDLGALAVAVFFLLSGYVMTAVIQNYYSTKHAYLSFIGERFFRIFPQYIFNLILVVFLLYCTLPNVRSFSLDILSLIENFSLLPLMYMAAYPMFDAFDQVAYIPQAWSLSLEWHFYLLFPLILQSKTRELVFYSSFIIFFLAANGVISSWHWGYHFLPGVIFIFIMGSILYDLIQNKMTKKIVLKYILIIITAIFSLYSGNWNSPYNGDVLLGILIGIPTIYFLSLHKSNRLDRFFGNLSYGVFLNHNIIIWYLLSLNFFQDQSLFMSFCVVSFLSSILSFFSFKVFEEPLVRFRHHFRK